MSFNSGNLSNAVYPATESEGYPKFVHPYYPWDERLRRSASYMSCAFSYEITFPKHPLQKSDEIIVRPFQLISTLKKVPCAVIDKVPTFLTNFVFPGDIILKINDEIMVGNDLIVPCERAMAVLQTPEFPKSMRIVRPAGALVQPSPAEAVLLANSPNTIAKFEVALTVTETQQLIMKAIDTKAPPVVRRMLTGTRINWEPYHIKPTLKGEDTKSYGVYKDRTKWVAVTRPKRLRDDIDEDDGKQGRDKRCHFLGRFDTEAEAVRAYQRAMEEISLGGAFVSSKPAKPVPPPILANPMSAAQQQAPQSQAAMPPPHQIPPPLPTTAATPTAANADIVLPSATSTATVESELIRLPQQQAQPPAASTSAQS